MANSPFYPFYCFDSDCRNKKHNIKTDTLKIALTNTTPNLSSDSVLSDISEISEGNGYVTGGYTASVSSSSQSSGNYKMVLSDLLFSASGGDISSFKYLVLYNNTSTTKPLIGYWDYGSSFSLPNGKNFLLNLDSAQGIYQSSV